MVWKTLAGGAGSFLGGVAGGLFGKSSARSQMQFQKRMSNTAHQREVKDLLAAGLNPILSAGGSGASSPGGAMSTMGDVVGPAVSTAREVAMAKQEMKNLQATARLTEQQEAEAAARTRQHELQTQFLPFQVEAQVEQQHSAAAQHRAQTALYALQQGRLKLENDIFSGPRGREILISSMGAAPTAVELFRQGAASNQGRNLLRADRYLQRKLSDLQDLLRTQFFNRQPTRQRRSDSGGGGW